MDIALFGAGRIAEKALSDLEKRYRIRCIVDSKENKWGTRIGQYTIKPPSEIFLYDCGIVVASIDYAYEISQQLIRGGIDPARLYLCRQNNDLLRQGNVSNSAKRIEIYPFLPRQIDTLGLSLAHYDLYKSEESTAGAKKKVIIFCTYYTTYAKQVIENISKRYTDIELSLLTFSKEYKSRIHAKSLRHIYCFATMADLKNILERIPLYDVVQLLWIENEWAFFYQLIREKTKRLVLYIGGSEFYRAGNAEREYKRRLIESADCIVTETKETLRDFTAYYGKDLEEKTAPLPYGLDILEYIKSGTLKDRDSVKIKYNIPLHKVVVTCGHNAVPQHQHFRMIDALNRLPESIKEQIVCVFPMTCPSGREEIDRYINEVREKLKSTDLEYVILTEFMEAEEMAYYAMGSDILIHVQTTDVLSGTMLEEMYAGAVVIAGEWLPYQSLRELGVYFLGVGDVTELTNVLTGVVSDLDAHKEKCVPNREIIWNRCCWDSAAPKWRAVWDV